GTPHALSPAAFGRRAAACGHRACFLGRAARAHGRRTDRQSRRSDGTRGRRRDVSVEPRARHHAGPRHPRCAPGVALHPPARPGGGAPGRGRSGGAGMNTLRLALRMLRRDAIAGELTVLIAALVLAAASVGTVGLFADRVKGALTREANLLLGADLMLS